MRKAVVTLFAGLVIAGAIVIVAALRSVSERPIDTTTYYPVGQLTAPGGPTGWVYCAIAITEAGGITTLFCEPVDSPTSIPPARALGSPIQ